MLQATKNSVIILGGAFDPITNGHTAIAKYLSQFFDQVWLMPCFDHSFGKKMTHADHRLDMCLLATRTLRKVKVCNFEITNELVGGTYHILSLLRDKFTNNKFSFAIGQDNADKIDKWINWKALLDEFPIMVIPREGETVAPAKWYQSTPHRFCEDFPGSGISSTLVRKYLEKNDIQAREMVDRLVLDYIESHDLYTSPDDKLWNVDVFVEKVNSKDVVVLIPAWRPEQITLSKNMCPLLESVTDRSILSARVNIGTIEKENLVFRDLELK